MVARTLQRKQADHHEKQNQMDGGSEKAAGDEEVIGEVDHYVDQVR